MVPMNIFVRITKTGNTAERQKKVILCWPKQRYLYNWQL